MCDCEDRVRLRIMQAVEAISHDLYCVSLDENYDRPCNCPIGEVLAAIESEGD